MMDDMDEPEVTRGASPKPPPDDEEILNTDNKPGSDQIITALSEKMDSCKSDVNSTSSPTNGDAAESGDAPSTSTSSPSSTPGAHQPLFHVRFTDQITRHGHSSVSYRIEVTKNTPPYSCHYISREYDDLVYLEQCLAATCGADGLIVPPLPARPSLLDLHQLQLQQQPPAEELLLGDDWQRDCRHMEKYLQILCDHPVYGADAQLQRFLVGPDPPVRALHKPSLLSRLSRGLLQPSHATHPDCSDYFQRHRVWISHYQPALQQMADSYTTVVSAQQRLSSQLNHLATAFNIGVGWNEGVSGVYQRLNSRFSDAMQECKRSVELSAVSSDGTLGLPLELHARYAAAEVDMLQRRTALLVDYEASLRALEKVKPNRYRMAEDSMQKAKLAFEKCSELAQNEIHSLRRLRSDELLCGIRELARSQIHSNQILQAELNKHVARLRQFPAHAQSTTDIPA